MISCGFELLVIEIIGVIWSNCRINEVAETPSSLGITISYKIRKMKNQLSEHRWETQNAKEREKSKERKEISLGIYCSISNIHNIITQLRKTRGKRTSLNILLKRIYKLNLLKKVILNKNLVALI